MTVKNAKITNISITMADHGCLTFWLTLKGAGFGKGYQGAEKFSAKNGRGLKP